MQRDYVDTIGPRWWHCCWMTRVPTWVISISGAVAVWFRPIVFTVLCEWLFVVNHFLESRHSAAIADLLKAIHNLITVPMVTIVGLYALFKQRRPGVYARAGEPHGSLYGMPSGGAIFSGLIGASLFPRAPFAAACVVALVCLSRVVRGFHTVAQVGVGAVLGCACVWLHSMDTALFLSASWVAALFLPFLVAFDARLDASVRPNDFNNLYGWAVGGLMILLFDVVVCPPPSLDLFGGHAQASKLWCVYALGAVAHVMMTDMCIRGTTFCLV